MSFNEKCATSKNFCILYLKSFFCVRESVYLQFFFPKFISYFNASLITQINWQNEKESF